MLFILAEINYQGEIIVDPDFAPIQDEEPEIFQENIADPDFVPAQVIDADREIAQGKNEFC